MTHTTLLMSDVALCRELHSFLVAQRELASSSVEAKLPCVIFGSHTLGCAEDPVLSWLRWPVKTSIHDSQLCISNDFEAELYVLEVQASYP